MKNWTGRYTLLDKIIVTLIITLGFAALIGVPILVYLLTR